MMLFAGVEPYESVILRDRRLNAGKARRLKDGRWRYKFGLRVGMQNTLNPNGVWGPSYLIWLCFTILCNS